MYKGKMYREMNRREKREYKRFMWKHRLWDGQEIIERLEKEKKLNIRNF
jgi:hypothetical protein